jgi:3-phenylpropionate/cinnamic acid dioxygenase small subunit
VTDLEADTLIRRTIARACQYLDDRRFRDFADLFTAESPDGALSRPGLMQNREDVFSRFSQGELARRPELRRKHAVTNVNITVSGSVAQATSDLVMYDLQADGSCAIRLGRYDDELACEGGVWLFSRRRLSWLDEQPTGGGGPDGERQVGAGRRTSDS